MDEWMDEMTTSTHGHTPAADWVMQGQARPTSNFGGRTVIRDYGDETAEAAFLRDTVGLVDFGARTIAQLSGADVVSFLNRMLTQDFLKMPPNTARPAALLERKGHLMAEMVVSRVNDTTWLDVGPGQGEPALEELAKYIVVDDVEIARRDATHTMIGLVGPAVETTLEALNWPIRRDGDEFAQTIATPAAGIAFCARRRLGDLPGIVLCVAHDALAETWRRLGDVAAAQGGGPVGHAALNLVRIERGVPWAGAELSSEVLPKEAGLEDAVSYTKGCYVGQETTYRLHFRGQPARRLMRLHFRAPAEVPVLGPETATETTMLVADGKEAGRLTSAAFSSAVGTIVALGFVKRQWAESGHTLHLGSPTGPELLTVARAGITKDP